MKLLHFKRYLTTDPINGQGVPEGATLMVTDHNYDAMRAMPKKCQWEDLVDELPVPQDRLYAGQPLDGKRLAFFYPGGIGDAACHTAVIHAIKRQYPTCTIRVYSNMGQVWFQNPDIEDCCSRPTPPSLQGLESCDYWAFVDGLVYNLRDKNQPNIYRVLADHFHYEIKEPRPHLYVTADEVPALWTQLYGMLGRDVRDDALLIFAPTARKANRWWPPCHWIEAVKGFQEMGYQVVTIGSYQERIEMEALHVATGCGVIAGGITIRELIVLASVADRIVCADTGIMHLGAAWDVPTVAMFGPFAPSMRSTTYPHVFALSGGTCPKAPCCWHDDGFPEGCPGMQQGWCEVLAGMKPAMVLELLAKMEEKTKIVRPNNKLVRLYSR